jgi:hypothetical protein
MPNRCPRLRPLSQGLSLSISLMTSPFNRMQIKVGGDFREVLQQFNAAVDESSLAAWGEIVRRAVEAKRITKEERATLKTLYLIKLRNIRS